MDKPVTVSVKALLQFKTILSNCKDAIGIRIGIRKAGCTGYMFFIEPVISSLDNDYKLTQDEINIFINQDVIPMITGTNVDYHTQGLAKKFVYQNDNIKMMCGCGDSFTI
ncbi:MAG: iron-sulfur cluster assembly accessory protein [Legionellales bacterium]|nr:iron-sulfur cluster assembly accessory protein [Legionellales bacterium]